MPFGIPDPPNYAPCPRETWQSLCDADPASTFYQTPNWLETTCHYLNSEECRQQSQSKGREHTPSSPVEVASWLFATPQGNVVLPLLRRRRFSAWHYFSPFGTYTAPVFPGQLSPAEKSSLIRSLKRVNIQLTSSPFTANAVQFGKPLDYAIQAVDLTRLDPANPMRDWEEGQQRRVRVSRRSGVTLRKAEDESDWKHYFALYQSSLARWGENTTVAYDYSLFDALRLRLKNSPSMALWLAEIPAKAARDALAESVGTDTTDSPNPILSDAPVIAAGYLTFYHQGHVVPWHGAGEKAYFRYGVTQALFHHIMADAARNGYRHFDLTGSSGLQGVASFKSRFGTREISFQGSLNQVGLYGCLARAKHSVAALSKAMRTQPKSAA